MCEEIKDSLPGDNRSSERFLYTINRTFNLPNLYNVLPFQRGASVEPIGTVSQGDLPDAGFVLSYPVIGSSNGCMTIGARSGSYVGPSSSNNVYFYPNTFKLSSGSPYYGSKGYHPPYVNMYFFIKY